MKWEIVGDALLFAGAAALVACSSAGPEIGDSCTPASREVCNGDDEVLECKDGKWAEHVPQPTGVSCTCPEGDDTRDARCVSAGFVGVAKSDRARPRGRRLRRSA